MDTALTSFLKAPWKAYCISLPRCKERRERFTDWAKEIGLTFTFWDATDKRDLRYPSVISGNQLSLGATACRLSHEALWSHCLENDKEISYFFILEDDAGFKSKTLSDVTQFLQGVSHVSKPWSLLQFGFGSLTGSDLSLLSKRVPKGIVQAEFCDQTHAILYTRKAVQDMHRLSQDSGLVTRPSDGLLLAYIQKKKGICLAPSQSVIEQTDPVSFLSNRTP